MRYLKLTVSLGLVLLTILAMQSLAQGQVLLNPTDDSYVRSDKPTQNQGLSQTLRVTNRTGGKRFRSFLKFNVLGLNGNVLSATLRLNVAFRGSRDGGSLFLAPNNWDELSITFDNAPNPLPGPAFGSAGNVAKGDIVEFDVTAAITAALAADGIVSFILSNDTGSRTVYSSKEGPSAPELVIQTDQTGGTPPPPTGNLPPIANAGPDQNVPADASNSALVTLDGSASSDPDGSISNYEWTEGATVLASGATPITQVTLIGTGPHTIILTVTDNNGATATDQLVVALNQPPAVLPGGGGGTLTFNPTDDAFVRSDMANLNFGDAGTLRVRGGALMEISTYLKFNVTGLTGPIVSAKIRLSVEFGNSDGGSIFPAPNNWNEAAITFNNAPPIDTGTLLSSAGVVTAGNVAEFDVTAAITADGIYSFGITKNSGLIIRYSSKEGLVVPELVIQTTTAGTNQPPVANAGADQIVTADAFDNALVNLDGSASSDPDGFISNYEWSEGATVLATGATPIASVTLNGTGVHTLTLTVTDADGATANDQVVITLNPFQLGNQPPVANAGPDQTVTDVDNNGSQNVTLNGSASADPDPGGSIISYEWHENGNLIATGANPTVLLTVGTHIIDLTVTDNNLAMATDQILVAVISPIGTIVTLTFNPTDDAYVQSRKPNRNFNASPQLRLITNGNRILRSYLKFDVSGLNGPVLSAKLRLSAIDPSAEGGSIFAAANQWNEATITFNNAPPITGDPISSVGSVLVGQIVEFDVTPAISINGIVSFCMSSSSADNVIYDSREGAIPPELVIEYSEGGNQPPVANAGPDQTVTDVLADGSELVTLNGSASFDADGTIVNYKWTENTVPLTVHSNGLNPSPTVSLGLGSHALTLTVTDDAGASTSDQVVIKINQAPVANAGADRIITDVDRNGAESVLLDGTLSTDPDGTIATYLWSEAGAVIGNGATPSVGLAVGVHTIDLLVTDNDGTPAAAPDQVVIRINDPPVANAGLDRIVPDTNGDNTETVLLDGSGSSDSDGTFTYSWRLNQTEFSTAVNPSLPLAVSVTPYIIDLVVTDNDGATALDQVVITVAANQAPVANAGPDQIVIDIDNSAAEDVLLDGSASTDDGTLTYAWTWIENAIAKSATGVNPTVTLGALGLASPHIITLTVTDAAGLSSTDQVSITVKPPAPNAPPPTLFTLTMDVAPIGGGTTTPATGTTSNILENAVVPITATASPGFLFVNWTGATGIADPTSPTTTVTMDGNKTITANFALAFDLTLLVSLAGGGTTTPAAGTVTTYPENEVVNILATPDPGFAFQSWTGAGLIANPNSANTTVIMDKDKTITANFAVGFNLTMKVFPPGAGTTTPDNGTTTGHVANSVVNITATPNPGYVFGYWTGLPAVSANAQNTSVTLIADTTITANFIPLPSATTGTPVAGEVTAASLGLVGSLQAHGPFSIFGFPTYYTDSNGLSLIHGVNVNDPLTPEEAANPAGAFFDPALLADPNAPLDPATGNFFDESFYFSAGALLNTAGGNAILVSAGGEAVWFTPDLSVQDGFQTVFSRFRLRVDLPTFFGETRTYTVTHPYGVETFEVTEGGLGAINLTVDSAAQLGFDSPLDGTLVSVDPFLIWTNGEAPLGYVGDPGIDHTVTGSPFNTNFFRIEGPDIGGPGIDFVQTNLFSLSGKIVGNGPPPPVNEPPVAYAGPDHTVLTVINSPTVLVNLDGTASFDVDGTITSFVWSDGQGTPILPIPKPKVTLPVGTHTITLTVTDDKGATHSDQVVITVALGNPPPVANAGLDQVVTDANIDGFELVTLDGSGSLDSNGSIVSYVWTAGVLDTVLATGATTAPPNQVKLPIGAHTIKLTVTDDAGATGTDLVSVTVNPGAFFTLTMAASPAGAGTTTPPAGPGPLLGAATTQPISAVPNPGFAFVNWTGTAIADPNSANTTVFMDDNKTVTANFVPTYDLTMAVFPPGGGTVTPAAGSVTTFNDGTVVNITATASPGFLFAYWTGVPAVDADTPNGTVTMDAHKTVTANFIQLPPAAGETTALSLGLSGSLQAHGPLSIFGFPTYYTDSNGLTVVHGVNVNDPLTPENFGLVDPVLLPDANAPLKITTPPDVSNFFDESFYFTASALMNTATGRALLVLVGGEAVFFTPDLSVQDGWQTVFNRFRIRVDLPAFTGETRIYTVTHPYGQKSYEVTEGGISQVGGGGINETIDSAVSLGFDSALDGSFVPIDPFLIWTNNEAPPGYVGNPNVDHRVTGSPFGTNFFRIEGPDIGGPGINIIETDLFSISGKIIGIPTAPVAGAGPDQTVLDLDLNLSEPITLDGSASFDLDGTIKKYVWRENNNQIATGVNPPPVTLGIGSHTITLTVTDNNGNTDTDQVVIRILPPTGTKFVLSMEAFPPGAGTTTPVLGGALFNENEVVAISATPNNGFIFAYWTGIPALDASTANTTVTMDGHKTVTANFIELPPAAGETTAAGLGLSGALQAYGPLDIFGFPTYYTDSNGLSLVHGVDVTDVRTPEFQGQIDPLVLPDAHAPLSLATGNFYPESFYFSSSALIFLPSGRARVDNDAGAALFANADGTPQDGFQAVFSRLTIRIDLPSFIGPRTYTVTHPYGVQTFNVTQGGPGAINFAVESGVDVGFNTPLNGLLLPVDPFLRWTVEAPGAPAGYVGDPNFDHRVTGSPLGTNFVRIEGPDIGGPGINMVETDLFSISGKILSPTGGAPGALAKAAVDNSNAAADAASGAAIPTEYTLQQNYPNPFNPNTTIKFGLPENSHVTLRILNLKGQVIATLIDGPLNQGLHEVRWDGMDERKVPVASGVYLYLLQAGDFLDTKKLVLVK